MKYRRLTIDELAELEPQFVRFLASNTVTADDWVKIKKEDPKRAEGLIEIFSDIVFQQTLEKVEYLEFKMPKDIKIFHCQEKKMVLRGILVEGETDLDFTKENAIQELLKKIQNSDANLKVYYAEKAYNQIREMELFGMMQSGCLISNDVLFKALKATEK